MLNHIVTEPICKDFAWQRRDRNPRRFPLEDITEVLEIRVSSTDTAVAELESWNIGATENLVVSVHVAAHSVGAGVLDLRVEDQNAVDEIWKAQELKKTI